jgi:hypothetical protein
MKKIAPKKRGTMAKTDVVFVIGSGSYQSAGHGPDEADRQHAQTIHFVPI